MAPDKSRSYSMSGSILYGQVADGAVLTAIHKDCIDSFALRIYFKAECLSLESVALKRTVRQVSVYRIIHTYDAAALLRRDGIELKGTLVHIYREV